MGLRSKTVNAVNKWSWWPHPHPQQKQQKIMNHQKQHACGNCDNYKTPTVAGITHELAGSTCFTELDRTSSYLCIVLNYESSLLMILNSPWGRFRFVCLLWDPTCVQDIFQWMMDQILTHCDEVIGITDDVVVHGKDDKEHDKCLHKFMRVTCEHGLVFKKDRFAVTLTSVVFLDVPVMPMELIWILKRSV